VYAAELPFGGDVRINATPTEVIRVDVPLGAYQGSATVAVANRDTAARRVDVWITATATAGLRVAGPRAAQADIPPGGVATVALGPVFGAAEGPATVLVVAQRDGPTAAEVWATEGTELLNRAGATAILVWGGVAVFPDASPR